MKSILVLGMMMMVGFFAVASEHIYKIKIDLALSGEKKESSMVIVKEGQAAKMFFPAASGKIFYEVVAEESHEAQHPGILLKFKVGRVDQAGVEKVIGLPQIIAQENEKAQIDVGSVKQKVDEYSVSALVKRHAK